MEIVLEYYGSKHKLSKRATRDLIVQVLKTLIMTGKSFELKSLGTFVLRNRAGKLTPVLIPCEKLDNKLNPHLKKSLESFEDSE